jgi:hypothetical protein
VVVVVVTIVVQVLEIQEDQAVVVLEPILVVAQADLLQIILGLHNKDFQAELALITQLVVEAEQAQLE